MPIKITGKFEPTDILLDTYPITDSRFNLGGHREVDTLIDRNNISIDRRREGMTVYVKESGITYQLYSGITNTDWINFSSISISDVDNGLSLSGKTIQLGGDIIKPTYIGDNNSASTYNIDFYISDVKTHLDSTGYTITNSYSGYTDSGHTISALTYTDLSILKDNILISSDSYDFSGLTYDKDYSDKYTKRSVPDVEYITNFIKYLLRQSDSDVMWGGEAQFWTDNDENPIIFENKTDKEHIVDLYNMITGVSEEIKEVDTIIEVTYNELVGLRNSSGLTEGRYYLITNFQTKHIIPNTTEIYTGSVERIIIKANTKTTFDTNVYSLDYPNDILRYDIDNDDCGNGTLRTGWITYREDTEKNIIVYYDFREVTMRRWWVTSTDVWNSTVTYSKGDYVRSNTGTLNVSLRDNNLNNSITDSEWWLEINNNFFIWTDDVTDLQGPSGWLGNLNYYYFYITTHSDYKTFNDLNNTSNIIIKKVPNKEINNITFFNITNFITLEGCYDIHFHNSVNNAGIIKNMYKNYIGTIENSNIQSNFTYNIITDIRNNDIGFDFSYNIINRISYSKISSTFWRNIIKYIENSNIGNNFQDNSISYSCTSSDIRNDFKRNIILSNFNKNVINDSVNNNLFKNFINVKIGYNFFNNKLCGIHDSKFGTFCHDNISIFDSIIRDYNDFGNNFYNNEIYGDFNNNINTGNFYNNKFYSYIEKNIFKISFNDNTCYGVFRFNNINTVFQNIFSGTTNSNTISNWNNNIIQTNFNYNNISLGSNNIIGHDFISNTITSGSFSSNNIGDFVRYNIFYGSLNSGNNIGNGFLKNIIYDRFINITTVDDFRYNYIKTELNTFDYSSATIVYLTTLTKEIIINQAGNYRILYYDNSNILQNVDHLT